MRQHSNEWNEMNHATCTLTHSFSSGLLPCSLVHNSEGNFLSRHNQIERMSMSTSANTPSDAEDDDRFVVVTTTYPSTYGCYRGQSWSKADMICNSHVEVSEKKYASYESAGERARRIRYDNNSFTDYVPDEEETSLHMIQQSWEILMPM